MTTRIFRPGPIHSDNRGERVPGTPVSGPSLPLAEAAVAFAADPSTERLLALERESVVYARRLETIVAEPIVQRLQWMLRNRRPIAAATIDEAISVGKPDRSTDAMSVATTARALGVSEVIVRDWCAANGVSKIGNSYAVSAEQRARIAASKQEIGRVGYSIAEAAKALGTRPSSLRRLVEHHAVAEGDEIVARLTSGIIARKRNGMGRWMVIIPMELQS